MYNILHQHYESVLRLVKLVDSEKLNQFYSIFDSADFLKLKPKARLNYLLKSIPIPNDKYFTLENFGKIAQQTIEEMQAYDIAHIDLRVSLHLERWKNINDISQAKDIYDRALLDYEDKTISFIAALDFTKTEKETKNNIEFLFEDQILKSIIGVDITINEEDISKFDNYYKKLLKLRKEHQKKIIIHLGEFTNNKFNYSIIKKIKPNRIAHGIKLLESSDLCNIIKDNNICLDICPVSNKVLGVVDWEKNNPIKKAIDLGIPVTINTDDPMMFNTNINKEIETANLNQQQVELLIKNSLKYAG